MAHARAIRFQQLEIKGTTSGGNTLSLVSQFSIVVVSVSRKINLKPISHANESPCQTDHISTILLVASKILS